MKCEWKSIFKLLRDKYFDIQIRLRSIIVFTVRDLPLAFDSKPLDCVFSFFQLLFHSNFSFDLFISIHLGISIRYMVWQEKKIEFSISFIFLMKMEMNAFIICIIASKPETEKKQLIHDDVNCEQGRKAFVNVATKKKSKTYHRG